jgi:elongation factor G
LKANPIPIQIPIGSEEHFKGLVDLIEMKALVWPSDGKGESYITEAIPESLLSEAKAAHERLVECICETNDALMEKYLSGEALNADEIRTQLSIATIDLKLTPVLCGASFKNKGVQPLLDAIANFLPSPLDVPPVEGVDPSREDKKIICKTDYDEPLAALAFKIANDSFAGSLTYVRVYSGVLKVGAQVLNPREDKKERVQRLVKMHANSREEVQELKAGDIGAVIGLKFTATGDTLCESRRPVVLERIQFPEPVISVAIEAKSTADQDKMVQALDRLQKEDPSCRVKVDPETTQMILSGMGELHLEILVDRLLREFKVHANVGSPQVSYRETLAQPVLGHGTFAREIAGKAHFAEVQIELSPSQRGGGYSFSNDTKNIPGLTEEFVRAIRDGIKEGCEVGPIAGYPLIDYQAVLKSAVVKPDEASSMAFKIAGVNAAREAMRQGKANLLEPTFKVEVVAPEECLGGVIGDLNSRRGKVIGMEPKAGYQVVQAEMPLQTMFGYATDLRSLSQGRATFSMEFLEYSIVPPRIEQEILAKIGR